MLSPWPAFPPAVDGLLRRTVDRTLAERLRAIHAGLQAEARFAALDRVAIALYDAGSDLLKTFIHSSGGDRPLDHYEARLADSPDLLRHARLGTPRVVNDLAVYDDVPREHALRLREAGYRSSLALPLEHAGRFLGFFFFNSRRTGFFDDDTVHHLRVHAELVALLLVMEFKAVETLQAAVSTARQISDQRDADTGRHNRRMAYFARLIAHHLAVERGLSDEFVEYLFLFAPLHDIGKVAIPDAILQSTARLRPEEVGQMRLHVHKGVQIVDHMIRSFGLQDLHHVAMLRHVVAYHHEAWDGSGYPHALKGEAIPLEARIVGVADVFDALTSRRSYKRAWSCDEALDFVRCNAGVQFAPDCALALCRDPDAVRRIQQQIPEDSVG